MQHWGLHTKTSYGHDLLSANHNQASYCNGAKLVDFQSSLDFQSLLDLINFIQLQMIAFEYNEPSSYTWEQNTALLRKIRFA